jgi:short-subunit dehydrogenase
VPDSAIATFNRRNIVITGASSGIGLAFAYRAAAAGGALVLVARRAAKLEALAQTLRATYGASVEVVPADLGVPGAAALLAADLEQRGQEIDVLINNAGIGLHGDLIDASPASVAAQIQLNVLTLAELTATLLPGMAARRRGAIINIASTAAFQPVPHMAVYAATKAFVLSFSRALWAETRHTGVKVLAVCPGATDTEFFDTAGEDAAVGTRRSPDSVVDSALRALARNRPTVVDGRANAFVAAVAPRLPQRMVLRIAEGSVRPSSVKSLTK